MKHIFIVATLGCCIGLSSCIDLDRNPLSSASSENWYSSEAEIEMSIKDFYRDSFWPTDNESWTDDFIYRETPSDIVKGTLNGQTGDVTTLWANQYKSIGRANTILANMDKAAEMGISEEKLTQYAAEAYFQRASCYARLVSKFGDVVYTTETVDIDQAFTMGRTPKEEIIPKVYEDYDKAAAGLPEQYTGTASQRATKGAALALKARFALYMGDFDIAADAAKQCMDLGIYKLHENYADLFLTTTHNAEECIFVLPRSVEFDVTYGTENVMNEITRNPGGWGAYCPSWDLLAAYVCTDGLPIDESPLFDPHDPFKNRDPRLSMTIVPFGENWCGVEYNPHPEALQVMNYNTGEMITNNDTRANAQYASYNGLVWKKGLDESCLQNAMRSEADRIIIRYADILLIYAEAKIELNQIDQSVLDAMNEVRARAYGVDKSATDQYPAFQMASQEELRSQLRMERRMEFPKEGLRYMDLIRWKLMDKVMTKKVYMMLYPSTLLIENVVNTGDWFWAFTPDIDENGLADFTKLEAAGKIAVVATKNWNERQYLWPIPTTEVLINPNMKQNPGY